MCFVANRGKNYKFQNYTSPWNKSILWFKKGKLFSENKCSSLHILARTTSGLKYASKGIYNQENGDISIFAFPLATVTSFGHTVACKFYMQFGHQPARLVFVCIKM